MTDLEELFEKVCHGHRRCETGLCGQGTDVCPYKGNTDRRMCQCTLSADTLRVLALMQSALDGANDKLLYVCGPEDAPIYTLEDGEVFLNAWRAGEIINARRKSKESKPVKDGKCPMCTQDLKPFADLLPCGFKVLPFCPICGQPLLPPEEEVAAQENMPLEFPSDK